MKEVREIDLVYGNNNKKKKGEPLLIKWAYNDFSKHIAGFLKGRYTIITGNTGSGKTKFTKNLLLSSVMKYKEQYPHKNIKVLWFALEESKENFYLSILSNIIYEMYGLSYSVAELLSYFDKDIKEVLELDLIKAQDKLDKIKEIFVCIDHINNPYGIYKEVRKYMHSIGEDIVITTEQDEKIITGYKYNNDSDFVFVVIDHLGLCGCENNKNHWETLQHLSNEYILNQMVKRFGCHVILIQQQMSETERNEYWQGETVTNKVKPTLNGLGKVTKK